MAGPTTPFEDDTWQWPPMISYPEQVAFMDACTAQSSRFSYKSIGTSVEGRPIYALYVGYPNAPTDKELRTKACTLVLAGQHGSETSGREGALQHARNMAFTEDPEMLSYLARHPMIYLPTVNPDGDSSISGTTSRENANGVGLNGNWAKLTEPETQVASTLLRDHNIVISYDMHQMVPADEQWWFEGTLNVQQGPKMAELQMAFKTMAMQSGVDSGLTTGLFDTNSTSANNYRNAGGLSHRITLLSEMMGTSPPTTKKKVECYINLFDDGIRWHIDNEDLVAGNIAESRHNAVEEGLNRIALRDPSIAAPPAGYRVALADQPTVEMFIDRYSVEWYPITGSTDKYVPLAQMARNMIAPVFDPSYQFRTISATREDTQPAVTGKKALYNVKVLRQSDSKLMHYTGGVEALSLDVGSLDAGETYEWYVQEQQVGEVSPWSIMGTFTTAGGATYDVEWRAVGGSTTFLMDVPTNQVGLNALTPGEDYEFRVQQTRDSDSSPWSAWHTFTTPSFSLISHGVPETNSIMEGNQFATNGPVHFDISGGDTAIADPDWRYINDNQLWLTDIRDIPQFNAVAAGSVTYTITYRVVDSGATGTFTRTVDVTEADETPTAPQGTWTIGTITKDQTTASLTPTYNGSDATSYEYTLDGSSWVSFTGTISLTGLTPETTYSSAAVRATNANGAGASASFAFTTEAEPATPNPPVLLTPLQDVTGVEGATENIALGDFFSGATSYTVTGIPAGSGLTHAGSTISGTYNATDVSNSPYTLSVTATNNDGSTAPDTFSVTATQAPVAPAETKNLTVTQLSSTSVRLAWERG